MTIHDQELMALATELMETRRLSRGEALIEARRMLRDLAVEALAWDYEVEQTQSEMQQYALAWDYDVAEQRSRAQRTKRVRLAA
ncbi:MAG: hypothetical protein KatS3mg057_2888 [Herpetosiphonaceae bacterium]|nr:MAG: hypothetical protein KatS3mg057_2888 [Herpetosiphonaceae bacterium]